MEGGRRMDIRETMVFPFTEAWKDMKARRERGKAAADGSVEPQLEPAE